MNIKKTVNFQSLNSMVQIHSWKLKLSYSAISKGRNWCMKYMLNVYCLSHFFTEKQHISYLIIHRKNPYKCINIIFFLTYQYSVV